MELRHFGFTTANLDHDMDFLCAAFGFSVKTTFTRSAEFTQSIASISGTSLNIALLQCGNMTLELVEYANLPNKGEEPRCHRAGTGHICIRVENISHEIKRLSSLGATFNGTIAVGIAPQGGTNKIVYGHTPNGLLFELVEEAKYN